MGLLGRVTGTPSTRGSGTLDRRRLQGSKGSAGQLWRAVVVDARALRASSYRAIATMHQLEQVISNKVDPIGPNRRDLLDEKK